MDKRPLIVVSLCAVVLLVLGSLSNVVGYNTVQSSNQSVLKERINQRELLFQTICDIANNKEIQRIILKSQISRGIFPSSEIPVITKNRIRQMYFLGMILSKIISKSRIQSMIGEYQFSHQAMKNEISAVIKKDATLNSEVTQLINSDCDCDYEQTSSWGFPIFCSILNVLMIIPLILFVFGSSLVAVGLWFRLIGLIGYVLELITVPIIYTIIYVGTIFDCNWWFITP
ncbi:MAG: hypothetical protein BV458_01880 [Thermoplasmata archaeon M9B2D]|nr:MAG: hypothetical protein BV458_01880 [Thermoplasmata archaeon M9B2D]